MCQIYHGNVCNVLFSHLDIMHPGHVDQVMLIVLNGVSYSEVQCHEKSFPFLTSTEYFSRVSIYDFVSFIYV